MEYHRYVSMCGDITANPQIEYIDSIKETSPEHQVFTYNYLFAFVKQLTEFLNKLSGVNRDRVVEISSILNQFVNDVSAVNINNKTLATNAEVSYNIGKYKYIRNKKMVGPTQYVILEKNLL